MPSKISLVFFFLLRSLTKTLVQTPQCAIFFSPLAFGAVAYGYNTDLLITIAEVSRFRKKLNGQQ